MNSQTALAELIAGLETRVTATAEARAANPPCIDPWCANGGTPCGHTPDAHMAYHGAAAILAGTPTTTQASARIANRESPAAPAGPPPSTVAEMREVLADLDASRPRSRQTVLGPSELGTPCQRQIAMKLAGLPRQLPDKRPPWAPMQGTAIHALMEEALRFHNAQLGRERWVIEERLRIDDEIFGHGDAYDSDHATVIDWKYVGVTARRKSARKTVPNDQLVSPDYRGQAHLYGLGHERAGRDVRWVRLVLLARSHDYDDSTEWTEEYNPFLAYSTLRRYHDTRRLLTVLSAWHIAAAPGASCDWCPFRRPGEPADATGCPGNLNQIVDKQTAGLIA